MHLAHEARLSRQAKTLGKVLGGRSDASIRFKDLCSVLERLGFSRRVRGSHFIFDHNNVAPLINLQAVSGMAKAYQVRQVRDILIEHGLTSFAGAIDAE